MSAAEFAFWNIYFTKRGFPADRIEGATAIAGAAVVRSLGNKIEPKELLPKFGPEKVNNKVLAAKLATLPGAKVRRIPRPERKAGTAKPTVSETGEERPARVLNPKKRKR